MSTAPVDLAIPYLRDIGPLTARKQPSKRALRMPAGTEVVSADSHWEISEDIFYEHFPARLKDKAPRVWFDKFWRIGFPGAKEAIPVGSRMDRTLPRTIGEGVWKPEVRYHDMDLEGVRQEIVFPHSLLGFMRHLDFETQELLYRVYNECYASRHINRNRRSHAVGVFSNWWDPAAAEKSTRQIVDLGLKTFMIPVNPGKSIEGKEISYCDPIMDRFWDVVAEAGLPICFHVAENVDVEHRSGNGSGMLILTAPFRKPFGQLVFGGVFDRHPNLKIVFAEGGICWVPPALQDAEQIFDTLGNGDTLDHIDHRPSYYWHNNCYATFQNDPLGMRQLDIIGAERVMWATDYPHSEGTFGYGHESVQAVTESTTAEEARAILGGTAISLFKLDR
jgi:predicted TIM-barrel fold metal-dependent hydrolase